MGHAFFIPRDPARFFSDNPDFAPDHGPPEIDELRFGGGCLSCGRPTQEVAALEGGVRTLRGVSSWVQAVPMCAACQAAQRAAQDRAHLGRVAGLIGALAAGVAAISAAASAGLKGSPSLLFVGAVAGAAGYAFVALALWAASRRGALRTGSSAQVAFRAVEVYLFRDPRKGAGAEVLCLRIGDQGEAERFGRLNPHAIPADRWDASYSRPPRDTEGR